jgi:hypothetical protein
MIDINAHSPILLDDADILQRVKFALSDWIFVPDFRNLPSTSGLYLVYDKKSRSCFCVGQSLNLLQRGRRRTDSLAWKKALAVSRTPCLAYKLISGSSREDTLKQLLYTECLLIGLLRPTWNQVAVPPAREGFKIPWAVSIDDLAIQISSPEED